MNNDFNFLNFLIEKENKRQKSLINLIASENVVPENILNYINNCFSNKYAEGVPGKRFYSGCEFVDELEIFAQKKCLELFGGEFCNVQPHSGVQANLAIFLAVLNKGDKILSMDFSAGGHLSHGHSLSIVSTLYEIKNYNVDKNSEMIDYSELLKIAKIERPKLIIAGASSYSREIDFKKFSEIAKEVGAFLLADISHISGLIASKLLNSPIGYADFITSTTHKTLRGVRGAFIIAKKEFEEKINRAIMPGIQGGPHMNIICGKAATFIEAKRESFFEYSRDVIKNAKIMAENFIENGVKVISGGTDTHLFVIDTIASFEKNGFESEKILEKNGIILNRNSIPYDSLPPRLSSGIRIGTSFMTSLGFKDEDFCKISNKIISLLK